MSRLSPRLALAATGLAAGLALAVAFAAEWYGGLVPCPLCLIERWPYRIAIAAAAIGVLLPRGAARAMLAVVLLIGLAEAAAAGLHVGVELHVWPSPLPECAAPHFSGGSIAERLRAMPLRPSKSCEDGVYPVRFLPLSFADLNLLYALAFSALSATLLAATRRRTA